MITVSETYDDNIFLTKTDKVSDYITVVTPGVGMSLVQEHTNLQLRYAPSFYRYADRDDQNSTAHSAGLTFGQDLFQGLRFNLADTYLKSTDPLKILATFRAQADQKRVRDEHHGCEFQLHLRRRERGERRLQI
jgi:hypothetical protein